MNRREKVNKSPKVEEFFIMSLDRAGVFVLAAWHIILVRGGLVFGTKNL